MSDDFATTRRGAPPPHAGPEEVERNKFDITRRSFLGSMSAGACLSVGAALLPNPARGATSSSSRREWRPWLHAAVRSDRQPGSLHTIALTQSTSTRAVVTPCPGIAALALHPSLPVVYAAADVLPGQALPHGHIEAFSIDECTGMLHSMARVPLSLSATGPRSLAVSPDGSSLLVAAATGGLWNAFQLDTMGLPSAVAVARKELGTNDGDAAHAVAHPHSVLYVPGERLAVGSDTGSSHISILRAEHDHIAVQARHRSDASSAPSHMALAATGEHLLVSDKATPSLTLWQLQRAGGAANLQHLAEHSLETPISALRAHPDAPVVYSARPRGRGSCVESWRIEGRTRLEPHTLAMLPYSSVTALVFSHDAVWAATAQGVVRVTIDRHRLKETSLLYPLHGLIGLAG